MTIARALTDTFAGISPNHVAPFIVAQLLGGAAGAGVARWLADRTRYLPPTVA